MRRSSRSVDREAPVKKDEALLDKIHDRFTYCIDRWQKIRNEARIDMRHVKGDPWDPAEKLRRIQAKRPVIALDELGQYENQVVNEVRANPRAIKFSPVGDGANDKTALFYGNKTREIEYRSHAQQHYTRAFQNMVERSYGYCKIVSEYVTDKPSGPNEPGSAFNKKLTIQGVPDPDSIYPDPDFVDATGRDWKYLIEIEGEIGVKEFTRQFPKAAITSFSPELVKYSQGWVNQKTVRLARYWEIENTRQQLFAFKVVNPEPDGMTPAEAIYEVFSDDDDKIQIIKAMGGELIRERYVEKPSVMEYRTNGVEILERSPWAGKWIPYVAYFGKMLWMDDGNGPELVIMSMTRLARDPNMLHAYYTSCEAEMIGITPKVPWWVWKGSLDKKNALKVQAANHEPVAFIEVDPKLSTNNQDTPSLPSRVPFEPPIQAIEIGKEGARRSIQSAMGLTPLPTSAQRRNEKSGIALKQIEESGQRGSYHFIDSYNMGIERGGEILEDLIPKYYDTRGLTPVLLPDGKASNAYINFDPNQPPSDLPQTPEMQEHILPSIEGNHAVTIDVGPEYASDRARQEDFVTTFMASPMMQALPPQLQMQIAALLIRLENIGPIGDQIAELLSPKKDTQNQMPPQAREALMKAEQFIKVLQEHVDVLEQEKAAKIVEAKGRLALQEKADESKGKIAEMEAEQRQSEADLRAHTDLALQKMQDRIDLLELEQKAATDRAKLAMAEKQQAQQHEHDADEAGRTRDAAAEQAERAAERERADA